MRSAAAERDSMRCTLASNAPQGSRHERGYTVDNTMRSA
jgi:hypothetical protein